MAFGEGFHKTTFPIKAGVQAKLPAIDVKLKGVIAAQNPLNRKHTIT